MRAGPTNGLRALVALIESSRRLVALTGAGCSTGSGIPDYRDAEGVWKRPPPVRYQQFAGSDVVRKRYWARSMVGWNLIRRARPNEAHRALSTLERRGPLSYVITQNVDGLHQKAGSTEVNDLHGRIDRVRCMACGVSTTRHQFQKRLEDLNPGFRAHSATYAPDGDADLEGVDFARFRTPVCRECSGALKPDVVFFGESVPRPRVDEAMARVDGADALLVVGSSLMVWSGYRFVKRAAERKIPVAAINLGRTRADDEIGVKVRADCGHVLGVLVSGLLRLNETRRSS